MATAYEKFSAINQVRAQQSTGAAETITISGSVINGGNAYTVMGATVQVLTAAGGSTCTISIGAQNIGTAQATTAAGTFGYVLSNTFSDLQGAAGTDISIAIAGGAAEVAVTLFIGSDVPADA